MSAIVFSYFVEDIEPGLFQENMMEMYKKNILKPVNFPTPPVNGIILQSCREIFTNSIETETETDNTYSTTEDQTNDNNMTLRLDDETTMTNDEKQMQQMLQRQRESMTTPQTEMKREKRTTLQLWLNLHVLNKLHMTADPKDRQMCRENRLEKLSDKQKKEYVATQTLTHLLHPPPQCPLMWTTNEQRN